MRNWIFFFFLSNAFVSKNTPWVATVDHTSNRLVSVRRCREMTYLLIWWNKYNIQRWIHVSLILLKLFAQYEAISWRTVLFPPEHRRRAIAEHQGKEVLRRFEESSGGIRMATAVRVGVRGRSVISWVPSKYFQNLLPRATPQLKSIVPYYWVVLTNIVRLS